MLSFDHAQLLQLSGTSRAPAFRVFSRLTWEALKFSGPEERNYLKENGVNNYPTNHCPYSTVWNLGMTFHACIGWRHFQWIGGLHCVSHHSLHFVFLGNYFQFGPEELLFHQPCVQVLGPRTKEHQSSPKPTSHQLHGSHHVCIQSTLTYPRCQGTFTRPTQPPPPDSTQRHVVRYLTFPYARTQLAN